MPKHSEYFFGPVSLLADPRLEPFCSLRGITREGLCMKVIRINHVLWLNRKMRVPINRLLFGLNEGRYKHTLLMDLVLNTGLFDCNDEGVLFHPELMEPIPIQLPDAKKPAQMPILTSAENSPEIEAKTTAEITPSAEPLPYHFCTTSVPNERARINNTISKESDSDSEIYDVVDAWVRDPNEPGLPSACQLKSWLVTLSRGSRTHLCELCAMRSGIRDLRDYWHESIVEFAKHLTTAGNLKGVNSLSELQRYLLYSFSVKGVTRSQFFPGLIIVEKLKEHKHRRVIELQKQYPFEIIDERMQRFVDGFHIPDSAAPRPNDSASWNPETGLWETDQESCTENSPKNSMESSTESSTESSQESSQESSPKNSTESSQESNQESSPRSSPGSADYSPDVVSQYLSMHSKL